MLQDVVSTEHLRSGFTLEGERETYLHRIAFQMLSEAVARPGGVPGAYSQDRGVALVRCPAARPRVNDASR